MSSYTRQRTYDQATYLRARDAWEAGRFGSEWNDWRNLAGKAGIIFPPAGTPDDSWGDESPSQRAILIRAIREQPRLLRRAITAGRVNSWSDVIERLLLGRDHLMGAVEQREYDWSLTKARRGGMVPLGEVLDPVLASLSYLSDEPDPVTRRIR